MPSGYSEISNIPVDKPGRRLYNVRGPMLQEAVSVLVQIDATEGNKVITVRSPLQVRAPVSLSPPLCFLCQNHVCFFPVTSNQALLTVGFVHSRLRTTSACRSPF